MHQSCMRSASSKCRSEILGGRKEKIDDFCMGQLAFKKSGIAHGFGDGLLFH